MFLTIHSDQVIKVLFDAYANQVFNSYFRERAHVQMAQEIKKCLRVFSMMVISNSSPKKGKSFHTKPMPVMVTNIKNEWVLVQLGCPQMGTMSFVLG